MSKFRHATTVDGNEAAALSAYRMNEVIAIYPITPSSNMGELSDEWAAHKKPNIWGQIPQVIEMQSEGGASGAVHGSLQAGALTTTFTSSQGLLLMIPNMYKIGGELTSYAMHVAARTVATHALSIFGDHSDVMACRQTGFALLASGSIQEVHDFAAVAQSATLASRVPFLHFFDGFRSSHEISKIERLTDDELRQLIDENLVVAHRQRALTPDRPVMRGAAQNPDTFFQAREAATPFFNACPELTKKAFELFAKVTGRTYHLFDYVGHPEAERLVIMMGSGAEVAHEAVDWMNAKGEKVGLLKVRLYRPFSLTDFIHAIPASVKSIAVLDRTKEPGAPAEPMHLDVLAALREAKETGLSKFKTEPKVVGGRYGLSCKEFTPSMVKSVFDNLKAETPRNHFTVGINDDVCHSSLPWDTNLDIEGNDVVRCVFYGLGSDGTVSANKNSIKIIGEETENFVQGYFVYDSKKAGATTISHLRFGPKQIRSSYLINKANFVACHQYVFLEKYDILRLAAPGATFLLNAQDGPGEIWDKLPREVQQAIIDKGLKFYVIDAYKVAKDQGLIGRINTIMQTCFFAVSGVLPKDEAIKKIKEAIEKSYGKRGPEIVRQNIGAVDATLANMHAVTVPKTITASWTRPPAVSDKAPEFVRNVTAEIIAARGDSLPVSAFPVDGTWPTATSQWEKRNIALEMPVWDEKICIQCNKCALVCPHAAIRPKIYDGSHLTGAPASFKATDVKAPKYKGMKFSLQVAPEDCTGCGICVSACPSKDKADPKRKAINLAAQPPLRAQEKTNYDYFLNLPEFDRTKLSLDVQGSQFCQPLFEYSGACAACGETPYVKMLSQLFGDRLLIANATGCSSIYGGNLPTTPYAVDRNGRGPAWSNSLFEDNAEFGVGFRLAIDSHKQQAKELAAALATQVGERLVDELLKPGETGEALIVAQRQRVATLKAKLAEIKDPRASRLAVVADYLVRKSVWILGGDGWAYDIGFGGLDHVLAMGRDVNMLVLDTQVYSNTGGQQSKATPLGAAAKFSVAGKGSPRKDLGMIAMSYGNVYVASVAFGYRDLQTIKAFQEADSYEGPSIIIAYSHCIAHGYELSHGLEQQKRAVESGAWMLYRFDPRRLVNGEPPLVLDSGDPKIPVAEYTKQESRFRMVEKIDPQRYKMLLEAAEMDAKQRYSVYKQLSAVSVPKAETTEPGK